MKSFSSLIHDALFPRTRIYQDVNGNFQGTSTDVTPWFCLLGRMWGITLWLYIIMLPLLAPVYFIFAHWYCRKYNDENMAENPEGWPREKSQILRNHRNILIGWAIFMLWGYCVNWGQNGYSDNPPSTVREYKWDPATYVDPYKQYKETHESI